ncbi:hypothetical protein ABI_07830 [Asticcacaulis biprosthecium C19]|uniref:Uncharacterized protein n=1 Tax=Asticcacaulis biprosthecium C19 TaxID=715226 RepID=F4QLS8_9CAUL|nr:hypothetical protein [Asticcacaulis biprosthecium]EGF92347.1 hypothetical protein ABI_07830 [Asticcacaulis biprosthecium C19]
MAFAGFIAILAALLWLGFIYVVMRARVSGNGLREEARAIVFDAFFGFLTSRLGGQIARSLTAQKA